MILAGPNPDYGPSPPLPTDPDPHQVTKKIAGAILSLLMREAQRLSKGAEAEQGASTARAGAEPNPYLRGIEQRPELYNEVSAIFAKYFDMYGEEEEVVEAAAG